MGTSLNTATVVNDKQSNTGTNALKEYEQEIRMEAEMSNESTLQRKRKSREDVT